MSLLTLKRSETELKNRKWQIPVLTVLSGLLATSVNSGVFLYPTLAFFYQRNKGEFTAVFAGVLLGSLVSGWVGLYIRLLLSVFFLLMICFVQLWGKNLYACFPLLCGICTLLNCAVLQQGALVSIAAMIMAGILCRFMQSDWMWIDVRFRVSPLMFAVLWLSPLFLYRALDYELLWKSLLFLMNGVLTKKLNASELIVILMAELFVFPSEWIELSMIMSLLLVRALKKEISGVRILGACIPVLLMKREMAEIMILVFSLILIEKSGQIKIFDRWICEQKSSMTHQKIESRKRVIIHQLSQFAEIFELTADYFHDQLPIQQSFLEGMAQALNTVTMQMRQSVMDEEPLEDQLVNLFQGYQFEVRKVRVIHSEQGVTTILCDFDRLAKKDAEEVILPLIQMVVDRNCRIIRYQKNRLFYAGSRLEIATGRCSRLNTKVFSLKKDRQVSGDTSAVFRCGQTVICTISDGMGHGLQASRSSRFVTTILQRMLAAGLPVEAAVKSINALLHTEGTESFATLDFLCYDQVRHQAYLSKSGACPTYLLRKGQLMELSGESLPIGIVEKIEADCYLVNCRDQDLFVMSSDGVEDEDLKQWILQDRDRVNQRIGEGIKSMEHAGLRDDVTVLTACVSRR